MARRRTTRRSAALKHGWRSGLEESIGEQLTDALGRGGFEYETLKIPFTQPAKERRYTPDFILPNGIIIETKGRFLTADRQKHKWIKEQYPDLDIRFVFSRSSTRISKRSKTTYAKWCRDNGFKYADREIPAEWISRRANRKSLAVIRDLREHRINRKK